MEILKEFVKPELIVLVAVLYFVGMGLKKAQSVPDKHIPYILGAAGIVLAIIYVCATSVLDGWQAVLMAVFTAVTQGILCAGCSVYVNQLIKQGNKAEDTETEEK